MLNPGFIREALRPATTPATPYYPRDTTGELALSLLQEAANPWPQLEWWESELQARLGILDLWHVAFLRLSKPNASERWPVPARMLYPMALGPNEDKRVDEAAHYVVAAIRQAREYYTAAQSVGVTALSRPVLYYYGALYLARAAVVAVGGVKMLETWGHGLKVKPGPSITSVSEQHRQLPPWPTLIRWERSGEFAAFFRMTRWDILYQPHDKPDWNPRDGWPAFHILECLRCLGVDWGALPHALSTQTNGALHAANGVLLLPYRVERREELYLTPQASLLERAFYETPRVIIEYMVLKYFADLARYYPLEWQDLLEAAQEPEGYVFRVALDAVAQRFVRSITTLLPLPGGDLATQHEEWIASQPRIEEWYQPPQLLTGHHTIQLPPRIRLPVWESSAEQPAAGQDSDYNQGQTASERGNQE